MNSSGEKNKESQSKEINPKIIYGSVKITGPYTGDKQAWVDYLMEDFQNFVDDNIKYITDCLREEYLLENIYNEYKNPKIVWWKKFLLFFVRKQRNIKFCYKKLGKTTYILRERNEHNNQE